MSKANPFSPSRGAEGYPSTLVSNDASVSVGELQRENPEEYITLTKALHTDTQRKVLYGLVNGLGEASYHELEAITTVSRRSLRKHVSRLEENGVVKRIDSNFSIIAFANEDVEALAHNLIYCYDEQLF